MKSGSGTRRSCCGGSGSRSKSGGPRGGRPWEGGAMVSYVEFVRRVRREGWTPAQLRRENRHAPGLVDFIRAVGPEDYRRFVLRLVRQGYEPAPPRPAVKAKRARMDWLERRAVVVTAMAVVAAVVG